MTVDLKEIHYLIDSFKPVRSEALSHLKKEMKLEFYHPYYDFFYRLTEWLKPGVVVELGSWQGLSGSCFALGSSRTRVITIDHHSDPGDELNRKLTEYCAELINNLTYCNGWTCTQLYEEERGQHYMPSENAYPKMLRVLNNRKIDLLFIDSWHRYDQAMKDWNAYQGLLSDEALVICDDICPGQKGGGIEDMDKFWDELKGEKFLNGTLHPGYPMGFYKWKKD